MAATLPLEFDSAAETLRGTPPPSRELVESWNAQLEGKDPDAIIRFAVSTFGASLAVATQFGLEGCTLLHRVGRIDPGAYFFTIDTGLLFAETLHLAERIEKCFGIRIDRVEPDQSVGVQAASHGPNLWETDPDACCRVRKVAPMQRVLEGRGAWMTAVRREQSETRRDTPIVKWDERFGLVKFSPLAAQTSAEIDAYVKSHHIPGNPLRLVGYQSIGCMPCTRPIAEGEDGRAGRWWRSPKTECGLHR